MTDSDRRDLESCYVSCMDKAAETGLRSIAFCCISTGVYGYPKADACRLAVNTVRKKLRELSSPPRVIFDVYLVEDYELYRMELAK